MLSVLSPHKGDNIRVSGVKW